jgi:hypothetical protein
LETYNVRLFTYLDGRQQARIYSKAITTGIEKQEVNAPPELEEFDCPFLPEGQKATLYKEPKTRTEQDIEHSRNVSMNRTVQKIYEIARSNRWEYFITLTFDPQKHNSKNYDYITQIMHDWLKDLKKNYAPDLIYLIVPELHADGQKYHFHGVFANCGAIPFVDSGHYIDGEPIYNIGAYKFGWSTATKVKDTFRVSSYITKYITKDLCSVTMGKKRYWCSKNCNRPIVQNYHMTQEEIEQIFEDCQNNIVFAKTEQLPFIGQNIKYIEMV